MTAAATPPAPSAEDYRKELVGFCYRYFGCYAEAEDAVQETMLRAWKHSGEFEGRSSMRTWLYRIATNVCLDMKRAPQRRALPMDLGGPGSVPPDGSQLTTLPDPAWIGPIADSYLPQPQDPAEAVLQRDSVRLALIAALQLLPPRQRVVLILRDVLSWSAAESAALLDMSVASVNSALARARRTMADNDSGSAPTQVEGDEGRDLLARYLAAFQDYDIDRMVALLSEDATFSMPPFPLWFKGVESIRSWWDGPGRICEGSRAVPVAGNGVPGMAVYHPAGAGRYEPFAIHLLRVADGRIAELTHFVGPQVFREFGLPDRLTDQADVHRSVPDDGLVYLSDSLNPDSKETP